MYRAWVEGVTGWSIDRAGDGANEPSLPDPSCLIVNYNMPAMNGLELVARLRDRHLAIPIILATGHLSDNIRRRAAAGRVFTIEKPFLGNRLFECVERAFAQATEPRT